MKIYTPNIITLSMVRDILKRANTHLKVWLSAKKKNIVSKLVCFVPVTFMLKLELNTRYNLSLGLFKERYFVGYTSR